MQDPNVNLGEVFRFLARGLVYAIPLAAVLAIRTYLFSQRLEPVYEASTTLLAVEPASRSATALSACSQRQRLPHGGAERPCAQRGAVGVGL